MSPRDRQTPSDADEKILDEIRERFTYALDQWRPIREEGHTDMRYVSGDPWSQKDRTLREDAGRVCLSLDELGQYFNQLINDVRANPRAPKFDPVGNGATDKTAQFYGDKMREIEYRSQAQIAYTTAFQNAVHRSYGWLRFTTKYAPKAFDQDLWIEEIPNPDLVVSDPDALRASSSDAKYLFYLQRYTTREFEREFPDAQITSFTPEIVSRAPAWVSEQHVQVAEYWQVEPWTRTLVQLQGPANPQTGQPQVVAFYEDEIDKLPAGWLVTQRRPDETSRVCMYLTNGVELLKKPGQKDAKVPWAGKYLPFVSCFGLVLYVDEGSGPKRKILSLTRLARDPYMLYCYYRTCEAEVVGMTPKIPYFVRRGSLKPDQLLLLQKSLHEPVAVIEVEGFVDGMPAGAPPEFPQRNPYEPMIQALEIGAEGARRAIQAAMGISPLPTQAQRRNEKSGVALQQIESSQQKGSAHFVDHYDAMLQHGGVIVEDLLDKVYDTARDVGVRDAKDNARTVRINDPQSQGAQDVPSVTGDHVVTVTTGPAFESQRQEGAAFVDSLLSNLQMITATAGPQKAAAVLGLAIKLKNLGELGDEMAKIITPPEFAAQDGQPPDPRQLMAQLKQAEQQVQQLQQVIQTKQAEKQAEMQGKLQQTQIQEQAETGRAALDRQTQIDKAEISANASIAVAEVKTQSEDLDRRLKLIELFLTAQQEARLERESQAHDIHQQASEHAQQFAVAQLEHAHATTQAEQSHRHTLAQGEQTAALTPPVQTGQD